jgi:hypothetical protein
VVVAFHDLLAQAARVVPVVAGPVATVVFLERLILAAAAVLATRLAALVVPASS